MRILHVTSLLATAVQSLQTTNVLHVTSVLASAGQSVHTLMCVLHVPTIPPVLLCQFGIVCDSYLLVSLSIR